MVKRAIAILMAITLCMTLIACGNQPATHPTLESVDTVISETVNATSGNEYNDSDGKDAVHFESPTENSISSTTMGTEETVTSEKEKDETKPTITPPPKGETEQTDPPKETEVTAPPRATETTGPVEEESNLNEGKNNTSSEREETVKQPEKSTPKTEHDNADDPSKNNVEPTEEHPQIPEDSKPTKSFDINYWIAFAKEFAQIKGLVLDVSAVDCWDNPIRAGSHCIYLERDIQSRLNRYANDEDITDIWIWAEPVGNDCYDIYIGYA